MIAFFSTKDNKVNDFCVNIKEYYTHMEELVSYKIECSCGIKGSCIKYGWYERILIINDKPQIVRLQRIYCKHCKKTHTIMPKFIIPYERQSFSYVLDLVIEYKGKEIDTADYELVRYINIYNKWENKLKSIGLTISDGLKKIITFCASTFNMCFMQSKKRRNRKLLEVGYYVGYLPT